MRNSSSLDWLRFMHTPNDYRVSPETLGDCVKMAQSETLGDCVKILIFAS